MKLDVSVILGKTKLNDSIIDAIQFAKDHGTICEVVTDIKDSKADYICDLTDFENKYIHKYFIHSLFMCLFITKKTYNSVCFHKYILYDGTGFYQKHTSKIVFYRTKSSKMPVYHESNLIMFAEYQTQLEKDEMSIMPDKNFVDDYEKFFNLQLK